MMTEFTSDIGSIREVGDTPQSIVLTRVSDGVLLDVNAGFEVTTGYSRAEAVGQTLQSLGIWVDSAEHLRMRSELQDEGEIPSREFTLKRKDGDLRSAVVSARTITLGGESCLVLVLDDVTDRKRIERALQLQKTYFKQLFDSSPEAIAILDNQDSVLKVNAAFERLFEYSQGEAAGRSINDLVAPGSILLEAQKVSRAVIVEGRIVQKESVRCRKDGSPLQVTIVGYPILSGGKQIGAFAIYRDIGKRKKIEAERERAWTFLQTAIEQSPSGILIAEAPDVTLKWANPAALGIRGELDQPFTNISFIQHPMNRQTFRPDGAPYVPAELPLSRAVLRGEATRNEEAIIRNAAGEDRWVSVSASPIRNGEGEVTAGIAIFEDVTDRKREEAERELNEIRLSTLLELGRMTHLPEQALTDHALEKSLAQTRSKIGYLAFLNEDQTVMTMYSWSRSAMEQCLIREKPIIYPVEATGLWGEAVRQRKPIVTNDYQAPNVWKKGCPEGHVQLSRHMNIPLFDGDQIVLVAGVGNKTDPYTEEDVRQLTLLMDGLWKIIKRKRAEQALKESEEKYRALAENVSDFIWTVDLQLRFIHLSPSVEKLFGWTTSEMQQLSPEDYLTAPSLGLVTDTLSRELSYQTGAAARNKRTITLEVEQCRKDGTTFWAEISARFLFDENGEPTGIIGVTRDITERRQVNAELQRLAAAIDQAGESIIITDSNGAIEYVNPAFERFTGYTREEARGKNPSILRSGEQDQEFYRKLWSTITAGHSWSSRMVNRQKDGALYTVDCTISPVFGVGGKIERFVAVAKDITAELRLEEDLRQAQRMESVGRLAAGVAHDFNNLLSPILGYTELLLLNLRPPDQRFYHTREIQKAAERARDLTRQLLSFGRKQLLQIRPVDLNQIADDMEKLMRRALREDIELAVLPYPSPCMVLADVGQAEQILMNLAVNAQDAMPAGGKLTVQISRLELDEAYTAQHPGSRPGHYGALIVTDTGCGMDEQTKRRIFEPFFSTKGERGTGLGLATVYGIVKQQGGNIWVYSEPGRGTIFKVYLPAAEGTAETAPKAAEAPASVGGSETLLLVEDNQMVRDLARVVLEKQGYTVISAASGPEALRVLEGHCGTVQLLLTDVVMPEMNGKELFTEALKKQPGLKALFMSGYTDNVIARHGVLDAGVQFIQKPFSVHGLASMVREALDKDSP